MKRTIQTLSPDETYRLLERLTTGGPCPGQPKIRTRNHCMALLMLDAGLRVSEVCQLLASDLFFADLPVNEVLVREAIAKGHRERSIPTTERLRTAIELMWTHWWKNNPVYGQRFAFYVHYSAQHITSRQVERIISRAGSDAISRKVTPHMLRHTFATKLMRVSNIRVVQKLLGHASITSTQIYTHPNSDDLKQAIQQMRF